MILKTQKLLQLILVTSYITGSDSLIYSPSESITPTELELETSKSAYTEPDPEIAESVHTEPALEPLTNSELWNTIGYPRLGNGFPFHIIDGSYRGCGSQSSEIVGYIFTQGYNTTVSSILENESAPLDQIPYDDRRSKSDTFSVLSEAELVKDVNSSSNEGSLG